MGKIKEFIAFKILKVPKCYLPQKPLIVRERVDIEKISVIVNRDSLIPENPYQYDRLAYLLGKQLLDRGFIAVTKSEDYDNRLARLTGTVEVVKRS